MRIIICDDELNEVNKLNCMLEEIFNEKKINVEIEAANTPDEVRNSLKWYDMAFLDIEMGSVNGIEVAEAILKINPDCFIFFVTNHSAYLDDAFDLKAFRYINKPVEKSRIERGVCKALLKLEEKNKTVELTNRAKKKLTISSASIIYIENSNRHTYVVTRDNSFLAEEPFSMVKALIEKVSDAFVLTHQSFFVNIKYVSYYDNTKVKLTDGDKEYEVHMSRRKYAAFDDRMFLEVNRQRW